MPYGPAIEQPECDMCIWWEENEHREFWCEGCGQDHSDWALSAVYCGSITIRCERCGETNEIEPAWDEADRAYHSHVGALAERSGL